MHLRRLEVALGIPQLDAPIRGPRIYAINNGSILPAVAGIQQRHQQ